MISIHCSNGLTVRSDNLKSAIEYVKDMKTKSKVWKRATITYYDGENLNTAKIVREEKPDQIKESSFYYSPKSNEYAIEYLRRMVKSFDRNNENLNMNYTLPELLNIWSAWNQCEWDMFPDQWSVKQLERAAKSATVPQFDDDERPID
jgi:hypothetical protein